MLSEQEIQNIAQEFGVKVTSIKHVKEAVLSNVYVVNDMFILRSRVYAEDTAHSFEAECTLIENTRAYVDMQFPSLRINAKGTKFVVQNKLLWTMYPKIEGSIVCNWWELDTLSFEEDYLFFSTLRNIHENTAGKVQSRTQPHYFNFFEQTKKHFKAIEHLLTEKQRTRVNEAFERVRVFESSQSGSEKCFVHGDYHPGNILVIDNAVVGLLDTDWARPGYRIEDLAMSLQMFLRDYKKKDFTFDKARFDRCLAAYRLDSTEERTILKEYFILCTVFDFYLTNTVPLFPRDAEVRNFQRKLLSYVCEFF